MAEGWAGPLETAGVNRWRLPRSYKDGMNVPGLIYADSELLEQIRADQALEQVANVACLPGILGHSLAMPDIHWGYGFPIGGVAATDFRQGVLSPGGVGFDINCGMHLLRTGLGLADVAGRVGRIMDELYASIPSGVGVSGSLKLSPAELDGVLEQGATWVARRHGADAADLEFMEERGRLAGADPEKVSSRAKKRARDQLGTLGSGNHFVEVQAVEELFDKAAAQAFGLQEGSILVMIHSGSRGLGHQVCTDYLETMNEAIVRYGIKLPDRQLACAPAGSPEGKDYFGAMAAAANFGWANRLYLGHLARQALARALGTAPRELGVSVLYDLGHNIVKPEEHVVEGKPRRLWVHRKGATRAFGPGHPDLPAAYREVGQPVLVPGDMGTHSYVLVGTSAAMAESFGSTCHGAGRQMSRAAAKRAIRGEELHRRLEGQGIAVRAKSMAGLAEEAPEAYKDVSRVVEVAEGAGLSRRVARLRPLGVMKG
ncbi:MAG: RtcB family protein [bacterium]|nr:RtcB family protein [bacterium]